MPHSFCNGEQPKRPERISPGSHSILKLAWPAEITLHLGDGCGLVEAIATADIFRTWT